MNAGEYGGERKSRKGKDKDGLLVVGWGGTYGTLFGAVNELQKQGENIGFSHFNYINPLPSHLRNLLPQFEYMQINKVQGQPFTIGELKEKISEIKI